MNTIDNRVVRMKFDNQQFESRIKTTLKSLENLKASLNFDGVSRSLERGFSNIEKAISANNVSDQLEMLSDKFGVLGTIGQTVLSNLTSSVMKFSSKLGGMAFNSIFEGGKNRALNIEQAKFQLEGLNVAWENIEDDISYGVQDTAYGLDSAAKAASQLVASGIQLGDEMKASLRGISGVAAMTSSSFDDIANVFTNVAGTGRVMAIHLNSLGARGINAAATLAKAMNTTEENLRDMVSKGQVDFKTFAKAMDDAYGEHAKDANKTFTGALSNTKAALSRIGAKFATPAFENLKDVLNGLIPVINGVNLGLEPFVDLASKAMKSASANIVGTLKNLDADKLKIFGSVIGHLVKALKNLKNFISGALIPFKTAFKEMFPNSALKTIESLAAKIDELTQKFKISEKTSRKVHDSLFGVFGAIKLVKDGILKAVDSFSPLLNVIADIGGKAINGVLSFGERAAKVFTATKTNNYFYDNLKKIVNLVKGDFGLLVPKINGFVNSAKKMFEPFKNVISKSGQSLSDFFSKGLSVEQERKINVFSEIIASAAETFLNLGTAAAKIAKPIYEAFAEMFPPINSIRILSIAESIESLTDKFKISDKTAGTIKSTFKGLFAVVDMVRLMFSAVIRSLFPAANGFFGLGKGIVSVTGGLGDWLTALDKNIRENDTFYKAIQKVIEIAKNGFSKAKEKVTEFIETYERITGKELKMPSLEDLLTFIDKVKDKFSWVPVLINKVKGSFISFYKSFTDDETGQKPKTIETIVDVLDKLSGILSRVSPLIGNFFSGMGDAFDEIDFERMGKIINIAFFVVLITTLNKLKGVISSIFSFGRPLHNMNGVLVGAKSALLAFTNNMKYDNLLKIALAISMLTGSLIALSMVEEDRLTSAMGAMSNLFIELFGSMAIMTSIIDKKKGAVLLELAASTMIIAGSVIALAAAVEKLGTLEPSALTNGLNAVLTLLSAVTLTMNFIPEKSMKSLMMFGASLITVSIAMNILAKAFEKLGKIPTENLLNGFLVMVSLFSMFIISSAIKITDVLVIGMLSFSASVLVLSAALVVLAPVLKLLGGMKLSEIGKGLLALTGTLLVIGGLSAVLGVFSNRIIAFGVALIVLSSAFAILAPVLKLLGSMKLSEIGKGLLTLVGIFAVFGAAAALLGPIIPNMIGLAFSVGVLGTAMLGLGAGMTVIAMGITALSVSSVGITIFIHSIGQAIIALIDSFVTIGMALLIGIETLIPKLEKVTVKVVLSIIRVFVKCLPMIVNGGMLLILGVLQGINSHLDDILTVGASIIQKLITALIKALPALIQSGIEIIVSFVNGVADGIRNNGEEIIGAIGNLISALVDFVLVALKQLLRNIPYLGNQAADKIDELRSELEEKGKSAGESAVKGFAGGLRGEVKQAENAGSDIENSAAAGLNSGLSNFGSIGSMFGGSFSEVLSSTGTVAAQSGEGLGNSAASGLNSILPDFSSMGIDFGTSFSESLGDTSKNVSGAAGNLGNTAIGGIDTDFSGLGLDSGESYAQGFLDSDQNVEDSANALSLAAFGIFDDSDKEFTNSGSDNGKSYSEGISGQTISAERSGAQIADGSAAAMNSKYPSFRNAGENSGKGFAQGLNGSRKTVYDTASSLAQTALNAMIVQLDINSPSKEGEEIGLYVGKGFAGGIEKSVVTVVNASELIAFKALKSMQKSIKRASDILSDDVDVYPTIRPVVDLSDITTSAETINTMFGKKSFSIGNVTGRLSVGNTDQLSGIISNINTANNGASDIVGSISDLRGDVVRLAEAISKIQIRMDSGALVGSLAGPLDNELGRRMTMKVRGV